MLAVKSLDPESELDFSGTYLLTKQHTTAQVLNIVFQGLKSAFATYNLISNAPPIGNWHLQSVKADLRLLQRVTTLALYTSTF